MALAERLLAATDTYQHKTFICKLMKITLDPKLTKSDIDAVITIINSTPLDSNHVPNTKLASALREEGYDISTSAVDRHRRGICACNRIK